jgi:hypothetical protein
MTKQGMTKEIQSLRYQMVTLKNMMKQREDKLLKVIELLEPFLPQLLSNKEEQERFLKEMNESYPKDFLDD